MPGVICGDYELVERGGATELTLLFQGKHVQIADRLRAVKVPQQEAREGSGKSLLPFKPEALKEAFARMCEASAQVARALDAAVGAARDEAAHIAFVESVRADLEMPYILSEWVPGGSLVQKIAAGSLAPSEAARIAAETLAGLAFAHERGITHGAVKPSNLLLDNDGSVKVADFGANVLDQGFPPRLGSVPYLSPEQLDPSLRHGQPLDARTDLFSLALVLYEMLTGRRPGRVLTAVQMPSMLRPQVSAAFDELILQGLQADPTVRFPSALAMRERVLQASDLREPAAPFRVAMPASKADAAPADSSVLVSPGPVVTTPAGNGAASTPAQGTGIETLSGTPEEGRKASRRAGEVRINEVDGAEMVWVPGGTLRMGSDASPDEQPVQDVPVGGFWVYRYPVVQAGYLKFLAFLRDNGTPMPRPSMFLRGDPYRNRAAAGIRWEEAVEYCRWAKVRLPTEAEWEWAARGPENRVYPWGDTWAENRANTMEALLQEASDVTRFPLGTSWCGAVDLSGNVFEWCSSLFRPYPYDPTDGREDPDASGPRVLRGGSATTGAETARGAYRCPPGSRATLTGFRPVLTED